MLESSAIEKMAWCLPRIYRRFWFTTSSPPATAVVLPDVCVPCIPLWSCRQTFTVPPALFKRLMWRRPGVDTCGWYATSRNTIHSFASLLSEHVASVYRVRAEEHTVLGWMRYFGTQRVVQKRRHQMRILHPLQTPYVHYPGGTRPPPIPHSLTATGTIKRLLNCNTAAAKEAASRINWEAYISHKKGVRWHPQGAWRVQFTRRNHERNFFVRCECYFKVSDYGFETAKELAIRYRERLEKEWEELQQQWNRLDIQEARARMQRRMGVEVETQHPLLPHATTEGETPNTNTSNIWSTDGKWKED